MITNRDIKELITLIRGELAGVKTCFACEIVAVNPLRKDRVSVRLSVKDTKDFDFPNVLDVPVKFFKYGSSLIYAPPAVGDKGLLYVSTKSTRQFKNPTNISYKTIFDIDNSYYSGGLFSDLDDTIDLGDNLLIKRGSDTIELKDSEIDVVSTTVNIKATNINLGEGGQPIARLGDTVNVAGVNGTITSSGTATSI